MKRCSAWYTLQAGAGAGAGEVEEPNAAGEQAGRSQTLQGPLIARGGRAAAHKLAGGRQVKPSLGELVAAVGSRALVHQRRKPRQDVAVRRGELGVRHSVRSGVVVAQVA